MGNIKNDLRNFQSIPRELVFDSSLSDRARFVYVYMACKPEDWEFFLEPMSKDVGYSVDTLRKYLGELVDSGWLEKGEQNKEKGEFRSVKYVIKTTKFTDTEIFRHGKNTTLDNIENNNRIETDKKEKSIDKKKELFEECWIAYRRKGSKKLAFEQWCKLSDKEKNSVLRHINSYVKVRERVYQRDFERYLRDKIFNTIICQGNTVVLDPTKEDAQNSAYVPTCGGALSWNEYYKCYMYTGYWSGRISDGYDDDTRPDGASVTLNNGRGDAVWNRESKTWTVVCKE